MTVWLAIDTATDAAGAALSDPERLLAETGWTSRRRHTVELGPAVERMLQQHDLVVDDLAGVALSIGPGSYTGLRIGLSFAKGLTLGTGVPIVPIPTLDVVAAPLSPPYCIRSAPLWAVLSAGRGRVVAARYGVDGLDGPDPSALVVETIAELAARAERSSLVAGELDATARADLEEAGLTVLPPAAGARRAGWLAELGRARFEMHGAPDPNELSPVYLGHGP